MNFNIFCQRLFLSLLLPFMSLAEQNFIILAKGQFKSIKLPANPRAGYIWNIKPSLYDFLKRDENSPIQLIMEGFGDVIVPPGIVGRQTTQEFNFEAKNSGTITITFEYKNLLATGSDKTEIVTFQVK